MAKGFSFVLVTVVMVMMLVFGLLSFSSAAADLRLSQKAAVAQQVYYALDSEGEQLYASCEGAAASSSAYADAYISGKQYMQVQPEDFYPSLTPLVASVKLSPGGNDSALLKRGIFFYDLEKQLEQIKGSYNLSYKLDQSALGAALGGHGGDEPVAFVYATITSKSSPGNTLSITLVCDFGDLQTAPSFRVTEWESAVSGLTINTSQKINVWDGK